MTSTFFKVIVVWDIRNSWCLFSRKFHFRFGRNSVCSTTFWFVEAFARFSLHKYFQGRELCWFDCMKYTFYTALCQDNCEPICFKIGMMLKTTKLYSLIPVWMTLMFTQGDRVTEKLELVQSFCCKAAWSGSNVRYGWLCKGDDCEEVLKVWRIWIV